MSIGVSNYDDVSHIRPLSPCDAEAKEIFDFLCDEATGLGKRAESVLLTSVSEPIWASTRANILERLQNVAALSSADESVIVYFSGHGADEAGTSYLICRDTRRTIITDTGIALKRVLEMLHSSPARYRILILDCCKPGFLLGKDGETGMSEQFQKTIDDLPREMQDEGLIVIASCKAHQISHILSDGSRSVFTHFLLEGLRAGKTSLDELYRHTVEAVRQWSLRNNAQQVPHHAVQMTGMLGSVQIAKPITAASQANPDTASASQAPIAAGQDTHKVLPVLQEILLEGEERHEFPSRPIMEPSSISWPRFVGRNVDRGRATDVERTATMRARRLEGALGAILLRTCEAKELRSSTDDTTSFSGGSYTVSIRRTEWYVEIVLKFRAVDAVSGDIREEIRKAWAWGRVTFFVNMGEPLTLVEVIGRITAQGLAGQIIGYVSNDYLEIQVLALGQRGKPARVKFEEADEDTKCIVSLDLATVGRDHTLDVLWRTVSGLLQTP